MTVAFYIDHCVDGAIVAGVRARGVDVLLAREDGRAETPDPALLSRSTELERVMFTPQNKDFLREATRRQREGAHFYGVIYAPQIKSRVGRYIEDLHMIAELEDPNNLIGLITYLPV